MLNFPAHDPARSIVIVPGNPGIPHLYCQFAEGLAKSMVEAADLYILGYSNFVTESRPAAVATIEEEAEEIRACLEEIAEKGAEMVVVAHSIGAWCVLRHLQLARYQKQLSLLVLAMPFLELDEISKESKQQRLRQLVMSRWGQLAVPGLARLLTWLPRFLQEKMAQSQGALPKSQVEEWLLSTFGEQPHHFESMALMSITEFDLLIPGSVDSGFFLLEEVCRQRPPDVIFDGRC